MYSVKLKILFYFFLLSTSLIAHPLHFSMTNVEYDEEKKGFNISMKLFTDDFQNALIHKFGENISVTNFDEITNYINDYVNAGFKVLINEEKVSKLAYISYKKHEDAVWINFFLKVDTKIKKVEIENKILMELYENQSNLLIFYYNEVQEGFNLRKDKPYCKVLV